jgi:hypothetical protein
MDTRTYRYRVHVKGMPRIVGWLGVAFVGGLGVLMVATGAWALAPLIAMVAAEYLLVAWLVRRFATTEVTLGAERIEYENNSRAVTIPYDEIERIESGSIPYLGGWIKIRSGKETIRLTVTLEGITDFVTQLKKRVDLHNPRAVYGRRRLFRFYKTAAYCEQSWARLTGIGKGVTIVWLVVAFAPILALEFVGLAGAIPIAAGFIAWLGAEAVFARRVATGSDEVQFHVPTRDAELERRTYFHAAIAWLIMVAFSVGFLFL